MRSRFIPDDILELFERRAQSRGDPRSAPYPQLQVQVNVAAKMREMWS